MSNKVFCPLPWTLLSAQPSGIIRVCSPSHSSPGRGVLRKNDGSLFRLDQDSFMESRNGELLKKLRKNMLNAIETPEVCQRCIKDEKSNVMSRRNIENSKNLLSLQKAQEMTRSDGELIDLKSGLTTFDLRFGNKCNLICRMCSPAASHAWYDEYFSTRHSRFTDGDDKHQLVRNQNGRVELAHDIYKWPLNSKFWEQMNENVNLIQSLHFSGGEPLLIEEHYEFLETLIQKNKSKEIHLDYNSNITILPQRALDLWKSFKKVTIGASIDGVGKVNDYIRYPSKFDKIANNLNILDQTNQNIEVWISTTVQAYNIYYLTDLYQWLLASHFKKVNKIKSDNDFKLFLSSHVLHSPAHLSVQIFPIKIKDKIKLKLLEFLDTIETHTHEYEMLKDHLDSLIQFMYAKDETNHFQIFLLEMAKSDQYRNQSVKDSMPDFFELVKEYVQK